MMANKDKSEHSLSRPNTGDSSPPTIWNWEKMYHACEVYKATFGPLEVSLVSNDRHQSSFLAVWLKYQQLDRPHLSPHRRRLLDSLGCKTRIGKDTNQIKFDYNLAKLQAFWQIYGHVDVPSGWPVDIALSKFVQRQRDMQEDIPADRKRRLEQLGFVWQREQSRDQEEPRTQEQQQEQSRPHEPSNSRPQPPQQQQQPKEVQHSLSKENHVQDKTPKGSVTDHVQHRPPLPQQHVPQTFEEAKNEEREWMFNYGKLIIYSAHHNHCQVPFVENSPLSHWVLTQRMLHANGKLRPDREQKLNLIGFFQKQNKSNRTQPNDDDTRAATKPYSQQVQQRKQDLGQAKTNTDSDNMTSALKQPSSESGPTNNDSRATATGCPGAKKLRGIKNKANDIVDLTVESDDENEEQEDDNSKKATPKGSSSNISNIHNNKNKVQARLSTEKTPTSTNQAAALERGNKDATVTSSKKKGRPLPQNFSKTSQPDASSTTKQRRLTLQILPRSCPTGDDTDDDQPDEDWNAMFRQLAAFASVHGHCRIPVNKLKDVALPLWMARQRRLYIAGKLRPDRTMKLHAIGKFARLSLQAKNNSSQANNNMSVQNHPSGAAVNNQPSKQLLRKRSYTDAALVTNESLESKQRKIENEDRSLPIPVRRVSNINGRPLLTNNQGGSRQNTVSSVEDTLMNRSLLAIAHLRAIAFADAKAAVAHPVESPAGASFGVVIPENDNHHHGEDTHSGNSVAEGAATTTTTQATIAHMNNRQLARVSLVETTERSKKHPAIVTAPAGIVPFCANETNMMGGSTSSPSSLIVRQAEPSASLTRKCVPTIPIPPPPQRPRIQHQGANDLRDQNPNDSSGKKKTTLEQLLEENRRLRNEMMRQNARIQHLEQASQKEKR